MSSALRNLALLATLIVMLGESSLTGCGVKAMVITPEKSSWPEVLNWKGEDAKEYIEKEDPTLTVILHPEWQPITYDYGYSRVRIYINEEGIVTSVPRIG